MAFLKILQKPNLPYNLLKKTHEKIRETVFSSLAAA